jgi:hypothetical protein
VSIVWVLIGVNTALFLTCGYWMQGLWKWTGSLKRWHAALVKLAEELALTEEGR